MRLRSDRHRARAASLIVTGLDEAPQLRRHQRVLAGRSFRNRIFCDMVSMTASIVVVFRVTVVRCELFPPALTYSNKYTG